MLATACARAPEATRSTSAFPQSAQPTAARTGAARPDARKLRVALLAPVGAAADATAQPQTATPGTADALGTSIERGARMAMKDLGAPFALELIDTGTGTAGIVDAAKRAVANGAGLVVGPVYATDVAAVSGITLPAGVPMLAFTSDTARATGGVYTNAFTPEAGVRAILEHAVQLGSRHVVVFAPEGRYGDIVLAAARSRLDRLGGQVAFAVRTKDTAEGYRHAAHRAAVAVEGADTIYIPAGGRAPRALMGELARAGVDLRGKRVIGSGQWSSADLDDPRLEGALFATNDERAFQSFSYRYEAAHARKPRLMAALAYDAVAVAVALARRSPGAPWSRAAIESPAGFSGATGLFRFRADGTVERRLAIREVRGGKAVQVKAPARRFGVGVQAQGRTGGTLAALRR